MVQYIAKLSLSHPILNKKMTQDYIDQVDILDIMKNYRGETFAAERQSLTRFQWVVTSTDTIDVVVESTNELSPEFIKELNSEIDFQNSDGLGESLEQQDFAWSDDTYFDKILNDYEVVGGASTDWTDDTIKLQKVASK